MVKKREKLKLTTSFLIWIFEGATLKELVDQADTYARSYPFDIIYIVGGICDITTKIQRTGEICFNWKSASSLTNHLLDTLEEANMNLAKEFPCTKFIFCPLIGADLEKALTKTPKRLPERQEILNEAVWSFNIRAWDINKPKNHYMPILAQPVHRHINNQKRNYYHHLAKDGLHLTHELKTKWADQFIKALGKN